MFNYFRGNVGENYTSLTQTSKLGPKKKMDYAGYTEEWHTERAQKI